jgi:hypothetical protein
LVLFLIIALMAYALGEEHEITLTHAGPSSGFTEPIVIFVGQTDTVETLKEKMVAFANSEGFKTDTFRVFRNGKGLDSEPWRRVAEYGFTGKWCYTIKVKGGGGAKGVKQTINKVKFIADQLQEKVKGVSEESKTNATIGKAETILQHFHLQMNANAKEAITDQLQKLSIAEIEQLSSAFNSAGAGSAEGKFRVIGHMMFGQTLQTAKDLHSSLGCVIDSANMLSTMGYLKAVEQDNAFSLRHFNTMVTGVLNFKRGQASATTSTDGMDNLIQGMNQLGS